jgi:hypothetical protein
MEDKEVPWYRLAYFYHIPVVHVNGREIARHRLDEGELMMHLEALSKAHTCIKE